MSTDSLKPQIDALRASALTMARAAGSLLCIDETLSPAAKAVLFNPNAELAAIVSDEGVFLEVSPDWERLLGWTPHEMVGRNWREFVHPDDVEDSQAAAHKIAGEAVVNRYRTRWDRYVTLSWYGSHWRGQPWSYAVAIPLDNTGQRDTLPMWNLKSLRP